MRITEDELSLPPGTRLLHIGPQKTGTTALQGAMHRSRDALREHGVVYPGRRSRPREGVWAALGFEIPYTRPNPRIEFWYKLVEEIRQAGDLRVCVSTENFGNADLAGARRVVEELGQGRAHVTATTRRLDRLLPSQWQQLVKMRLCTLSWEEWLHRVLGDDRDDPVWRTMWTPHDIDSLVERWVEALGSDPSAFTLVVADESDHGQLPRVFERMLALPEGFLTDRDPGPRNPSLSGGRVEAIRRLNELYQRRGWGDDPGLDALQIKLTGNFKYATRWPDEAPLPAFPAWAAQRVTELGEQRAELVKNLGVRVVGDPAGLSAPPLPTAEADGPPMVSAELAVAAVERTIDELRDQHGAELAAINRKVERLQRRLDRARARPTPEDLSGRELLRLAAGRAVRRLPTSPN